MRFTTFLINDQPRLGLDTGAGIIDMNQALPDIPSDLRTCLSAGLDLIAAADAAMALGPSLLPYDSLTFAPLIPEPGKIVCLGLNYFAHAQEGGRQKPEYPWIFLRCASSLLAHRQPGRVPKVSSWLDYEGELAAVIGPWSVPRHVSPAEAGHYVFGYTCFNDISIRDFQRRTPQWTVGKNFDATGAFGPVLVTSDELPAGASGLRIQTRLNGQVMQDANTSDMIWNVSETIALLSEVMTLNPGDVIVLGTPAGVGSARKPPVWMKSGDVVEVEIEGIGTLVNPILDEV
jgi:2-keto-4-pentenoate hydratase/2-oxohepta-3-ene-1,7-dioic acid hydratase in catechol pathway